MKKRAKVHLLPTDKADGHVIFNRNGLLTCHKGPFTQEYLRHIGATSHHLYITTDDEIKEGDYCIEEIGGSVFGPYSKDDVIQNPKKIIATTDPELVTKEIEVYEVQAQKMEGHYHKELPSPSKSFIEEYCKAGGIDEVDVEYGLFHDNNFKDDDETHAFKATRKPKVTSNNEIIIHPIEEKMTAH